MFDFAASGKLESASVVGVLIALVRLVITGTVFKLGDNLGIETGNEAGKVDLSKKN